MKYIPPIPLKIGIDFNLLADAIDDIANEYSAMHNLKKSRNSALKIIKLKMKEWYNENVTKTEIKNFYNKNKYIFKKKLKYKISFKCRKILDCIFRLIHNNTSLHEQCKSRVYNKNKACPKSCYKALYNNCIGVLDDRKEMIHKRICSTQQQEEFIQLLEDLQFSEGQNCNCAVKTQFKKVG